MNEFSTLDEVLSKTVENYPKELSAKLFHREIFRRWKELVGITLSSQLTPIKFEDKMLVLRADNSAVMDTVKFLAREIVMRLNEEVGGGEEIIEKLRIGKGWERLPENFEETVKLKTEKKSVEKKFSPDEINLTKKEISACEKKLPNLKDEARRQELLETFLNRAKLRKWQSKNGWHKCKICDSLCEPSEILCDYCKIHEREEMRKKIRQIFFDVPWSLFPSVQKKICKAMPHMKNECTLSVIESVWSSLVIETAARVSFGDKTSLDAKFLVMLFKHVNKNKLTEKIIDKALKELRFNLADQPPPINLKK